MPCYFPIPCWRGKSINPDTGKRPMVFSPLRAYQADFCEKIPCGQCVGCRLDRSRQWAIRCMHEASLYSNNCFITLTFSPDALMSRSNPWSLDVRDFQLFMKRLRKKFGEGIRFYHCGEYGEKHGRPHYHACLFNFDFPDKELWSITPSGHRLYISDALSELWPFGFSTIGDVTFESAAYCARYIMKKVNGQFAEEHYQWFDEDTGEIGLLKPEYTTMSRRPGIGRFWIDHFIDDVYPRDFVVINGKKCKPPRYYDGVAKLSRPFEFDDVLEARLIKAADNYDNNTQERLDVRYAVCKSKITLLKRTIE